MTETVPHPKLHHWSFQRKPLIQQPKVIPPISERDRVLNAVIYRILTLFRINNPTLRPAMFRVAMGFVRLYFKAINRLEVVGRENLPDRGLIIMNHPGSLDVLLLLCAVRKIIGCFVGYDNFVFIKLLEKYFGFINREAFGEHRDRDWLIEKMIENVLLRNSFFAIWPEGTISNKTLAMYGFSSIAKVYATLNSQKDCIPFVPVTIKGSHCYVYNLRPRFNKITIHILPPVWIPRDWLKSPDEGGKTPRSMIDYAMEFIAKDLGQKRLYNNPRLYRKREKYRENAE
jgi:1-acyl-sn-glycerol-3-phosphate acyltransferase